MRQPREHRRGMTLVELLTVVTILTILMAVAIPVMRPALKDRKLREASRMLNTFISLAKSKAVESGRPHGIWIARDPNNTNAAYQIFLAETPIPFAGDSINATATMEQGSALAGYAATAKIQNIQNLVQQGDYIRFGYKGPRYYITSVAGTAPSTITFISSNNQPYPPLASSLPFQIYRQPIRVTSQPLQLPTGTVIDLAFSGVGYSGYELNGGTSDIAIMFQPNGAVEQVYGASFNIPGTIHLLVGRTDGTPALQTDTSKTNLADGTTSWVSIGHLTGTVTTAENVVSDVNAVSMADATAIANSLRAARAIAQSKQTMGGR